MRIGRKSNGQRGRLRLLFATDLHGSDVVFRKFLNAVSVYEADVAVLGGDLTGKRIVPVVGSGQTYRAEVVGSAEQAQSPGELEVLEARIRDLGQYPVRMTEDEYADLRQDAKRVDELFREECDSQVADWMARAAARLAPAKIPIFVTGGNDDYLSIERIIDDAAWVVNAEGRVVELADGVEMISTGYGNPTPWHCPRDISEEELADRIEQMAERLSDTRRAIFNLHVPPHGSGLDYCPKLDTSVSPPRPVAGEEIAAGSTAVVRAIERYQPALSLHGHIHESGGIRHIGRTVSVNPGSEYGEGVLRSAVIDITGDRIAAQLLTA